jgi:hypothetical protein
MANVKAVQSGRGRDTGPKLFEIPDSPEPFRIIAANPFEAAMEWLAWKEKQPRIEALNVPCKLVTVRETARPWALYLATTVGLLQARDRERRRCGLPPFWEPVIEYLEMGDRRFVRELARRFGVPDDDEDEDRSIQPLNKR